MLKVSEEDEGENQCSLPNMVSGRNTLYIELKNTYNIKNKWFFQDDIVPKTPTDFQAFLGQGMCDLDRTKNAKENEILLPLYSNMLFQDSLKENIRYLSNYRKEGEKDQ